MTTDKALKRILSLLERLETDPAAGAACEAEMRHALEVLDASEIEVPEALRNLCHKLTAQRRAQEEQESTFDNMPV